jgi:hypothetical protein
MDKFTRDVLENFSLINPSIYITPDNKLKTISAQRNIYAVADIVDKFPVEFGIYDIRQLLRSISLFKTPEFEYQQNSLLINENAQHQPQMSIEYLYTPKSVIIVAPDNIIDLQWEITVTLTKDIIKTLSDSCQILQIPMVHFFARNKSIFCGVFDHKVKSSNRLEIKLADGIDVSNDFFLSVELFNNIKLFPGEYDVDLTADKGKICRLINKNSPIKYWIACER